MYKDIEKMIDCFNEYGFFLKSKTSNTGVHFCYLQTLTEVTWSFETNSIIDVYPINIKIPYCYLSSNGFMFDENYNKFDKSPDKYTKEGFILKVIAYNDR